MDIISIYKTYYNKIYNYALRLCCHPEDAKDITQETFLTALTKIDTLKHEEAVLSWLRSICYNNFINQTRKNKYLTEVDNWSQLEIEGRFLHASETQPEIEVFVSEEIRDLQNGCFLAMVRRLTLNQRIAFSLVDMYGMKINEVADILQVSIQAAKGLLYRARMNIDSFFANHCDILNVDNPCSCKAWIEFSLQRSNMQQRARQIINKLDYKKDCYVYDDIVRKKIYYLYRNMPEMKPSNDWYETVLIILQENNKKT